MSQKVDDLIANGAVQRSRKYRRVFMPPTVNGSCLLWLKDNRPDVYDRIVEEALHRAESEARASLWHSDQHEIELTVEEFAEFYEKRNGKKPWTPDGKEPCPHCRSLGHMHRRDCPRDESVGYTVSGAVLRDEEMP